MNDLLLPAIATSGPPLTNVVHHAAALALLNALPADSIDMALLDLPYGTTACAWDEIIPFAPMWTGLKRVCKRGAAMVFTASQPFTSALVMSNVKMFKHEWVWEKSIGSNFANAKHAPFKEHESVLVFAENRVTYYAQPTKRSAAGLLRAKYKDNPGHSKREYIGGFVDTKVRHRDPNNRVPSSIIRFDNERGLHPVQKPVALFEYLIRTYTQPDDVVLDFVCGSGTSALAAQNTGRKFICGDQSAEYVEIARHRLATSTLPLPMFEAG